jgi:hypothetical protein
MSDTVVAIVGAFFVIGILVGIVVVVAAAVLRADRRGHRDDPGDPMTYQSRGSGEPPSAPSGDDSHPYWPGDDDNDFTDR